MSSKKTKLLILSVALILLGVSASAFAMYLQNCKQILREVDRYAQPYIITVMEALSTWEYENIAPHLTDKYISLLPPEEWQKELDELAILGELRSFGRPRFVSHTPFTKYFICESAVDVYSVSTEFEHANGVVTWNFVNDCGKFTVSNFRVTSAALKPKPKYMEEIKTDEQELDLEIDLEELEKNLPPQDDLDLDNYNFEQAPDAPKKAAKEKKPPKGRIYRY